MLLFRALANNMAPMTNHDECWRITNESPYAFSYLPVSLYSIYSLTLLCYHHDSIYLVRPHLYYPQLHSQKRHRLVASCQLVLPISCNKLINFIKLQQAYQFHQIATSLLRSGLLQLVICRHVTTCWSNLQQTSMLTTCYKLVDKLQQTCCHKLSQVMRTHPIPACCNKLLQDVNRLITTWPFLAVYDNVIRLWFCAAPLDVG